MNNWKKRSVSLILALLMVFNVAAITGCGSKDEGEKAPEAKDTYIDPDTVEVREENPLTGLNIAYLGSSVMEGTANKNVSFVEYIAKRNQGSYVKETKADSTMADTGEDSYIPRLKKMDTEAKFDLFLCEIPFADVEQGVKAGDISASTDLENLDTTTTIGAMEYIAGYVQQTWGIPVVFFSNVNNGDGDYTKLVQAMWNLESKWGCDKICAWFLLGSPKKDSYMADDKHPTGTGYLKWIVPFMEKKLNTIAVNTKPEYDPENVEVNEPNILNGKNIIYLGSSVTYGSASRQVSFAEYIAKRNNTTYTKEAVSGTTLVDNGDQSYIRRMINNIDPNEKADLFICQLSTNDATGGQPMGEISDSTNLEDFDTTTVIGAMEYIICYAKQTWNCPVMFYTGTKYDSEQYGKMVEALKELQKKYGIGVIDMWDNLDTDIPEYSSYMSDGIHPNRAGYLKWWTPYMEQCIIEYLSEQQ